MSRAYAEQEPVAEDDEVSGEFVQIYRKIPVAGVDIGKDGSVPFEVAVLAELAQHLLNAKAGEVTLHDGAMHDRYEASWKGHSVVVKLGDFATEDES